MRESSVVRGFAEEKCLFGWRRDGDFMVHQIEIEAWKSTGRNVGIARAPRAGRSAKARTWKWESEVGKRKPNPVDLCIMSMYE